MQQQVESTKVMTGRLANIKKEKTEKPVRVLIYGIEGVGKSKFGADAPNSCVIGAEGGTDHLDNTFEIPNIKTFSDVLEAVKELTTGEHNFKSLMLDSADWIERMAHAEICGEGGNIITALKGYGAGYRRSETMHKELIDLLSELRAKRGMHIIVTAHYHVKTVKDPEATQDYDAFEIKCHEYVSALWREWVDAVLFARFETFVKKNEDSKKGLAFGTGNRIMYAEKRPAFYAKNRYGLPFEMDVSWNSFYAARLAGKGETVEQIMGDVNELHAKISDEATKKAVADAVTQAGTDKTRLYEILNRLRVITKH